jgi:hypothetical protein
VVEVVPDVAKSTRRGRRQLRACRDVCGLCVPRDLHASPGRSRRDGRGAARSVLNLGDLREDFAAKEPDVVDVRDVVQVEVDGVGVGRAELGQTAEDVAGVPVTPLASIRASASPRAAARRAAWPLDPGVDLQRGDLPTGSTRCRPR